MEFLKELNEESSYECQIEYFLMKIQYSFLLSSYDLSDADEIINSCYITFAFAPNCIKLIKDIIYLSVGLMAFCLGGVFFKDLRGFLLNEALIVFLNAINTAFALVSTLTRFHCTVFSFILGSNAEEHVLDHTNVKASWNSYGKKSNENDFDKTQTFFRSPVDHVITEAIFGAPEIAVKSEFTS